MGIIFSQCQKRAQLWSYGCLFQFKSSSITNQYIFSRKENMFNIHSIYVKHKIHLKGKNNCCQFQKLDMLIWVHFFQWRKHDEVIEVKHTCIMYVRIHLPTTTTTTKRSHTQQTHSMILNRKQQIFNSKMTQISICEFLWVCVLCNASTQISWTRVPPWPLHAKCTA